MASGLARTSSQLLTDFVDSFPYPGPSYDVFRLISKTAAQARFSRNLRPNPYKMKHGFVIEEAVPKKIMMLNSGTMEIDNSVTLAEVGDIVADKVGIEFGLIVHIIDMDTVRYLHIWIWE